MAIGRDAGERRLRQLRPAAEQFLGARALQSGFGMRARRGSGNPRLPRSGNERPIVGAAHARETDESSAACQATLHRRFQRPDVLQGPPRRARCRSVVATDDCAQTRAGRSIILHGLRAAKPESALISDTTQMTYDALIVGFGPVGATMANLLARRGLRVGVVEAELEIYDKPRALTFDHEVMRDLPGLRAGGPHRGVHRPSSRDPLPRHRRTRDQEIRAAAPALSSRLAAHHHVRAAGGREAAARAVSPASAAVDVFLGHRGVAFTQDDRRRGAHGSRRRAGRGARPAGAHSARLRRRQQLRAQASRHPAGGSGVRRVVDGRRRADPASRGSAAAMHPVLLAVAAGDLRPRARQSAPLGDQAAARRAARGIRPARERRPADLPLRRSILRRDLALRRLSLSCAARRALAARPRLSAGRCMPSDPAFSRPGHVRRHSRRGKPRLEAGDGPPGRRAGRAARQLRAGAQAACPHAGGDRQGIRSDHRRARPGSGADPRRDVARPTRARRGRNDPPALRPQSHDRDHRPRPAERAEPAPCSCSRRSSATRARTRRATRSFSTIFSGSASSSPRPQRSRKHG